MELSVNRLILKSFYYLGEWNPNHQPEGWMMTEAVDYLNEMLAEWRSERLLIPFLQTVSFTATPGQGQYVFANTGTYDIESPKLAELDYLEFIFEDVVYPINVIPAAAYYENYRLTNLQSLMSVAFLIQDVNSSILTFYPIPDRNYQVNVRGKFVLSDVALNDDVVELPDEYVSVLYMGLARKLSNFYETANWSKERTEMLETMKKSLRASNFEDLWVTNNKSNSLMGGYRVLAGV
jgi:hypothetical protein